MAAKKRQKYGLGSILAIALPKRRYAYAKVYRDHDLAVYDLVTEHLAAVSEVVAMPFLYFQFCTDEPIRKGEWLVIGEEPFANDELAWGPPKVAGIIPGLPFDPKMAAIRERDQQRRAEPGEIDGMDSCSVCQTSAQFLEILDERLIRRDHSLHRITL